MGKAERKTESIRRIEFDIDTRGRIAEIDNAFAQAKTLKFSHDDRWKTIKRGVWEHGFMWSQYSNRPVLIVEARYRVAPGKEDGLIFTILSNDQQFSGDPNSTGKFPSKPVDSCCVIFRDQKAVGDPRFTILDINTIQIIVEDFHAFLKESGATFNPPPIPSSEPTHD